MQGFPQLYNLFFLYVTVVGFFSYFNKRQYNFRNNETFIAFEQKLLK